MERFPHKLIGGGAALLAVTAALGWGGVNLIISGTLRQKAKLTNNTENWRNWEVIPDPMYLNFYLFNLENPKEMLTGEKPKVKEMGPYVYKQQRTKTDIVTETKENDTIVYREIFQYEFVREMSSGDETDMVTTLNIPYVGLANMAKELDSNGTKLRTIIETMLTDFAEQLYVTHPVKELLFDGYGIKPYTKLPKSEEFTEELANLDIPYPSFLMEDRFGLYKDKNGGDKGIWEISAGRVNASEYGEIITWNEMEYLPYWKDDECNGVANRTDGTLVPPPVKETTVMQVFYPEFCRFRNYTFEMYVITHDLKGMRFRIPHELTKSPANNPKNWCFCPYDDINRCGLDGIEYLAPCYEGIPLILSQPHFMGADKQVSETVEGLKPEVEKHETYIDIHSVSSYILQSRRRWQLSMQLTKVPDMASFNSVAEAYVPIVWIEELADIGERKLNILKFLREFVKTWQQLRWGLLALSGGIIMAGIGLAMTRRVSGKVDKITLMQ